MKISEFWLREWVNPNNKSDDLCDQLTMAGLEIDACEAIAGDFDGVVVGRVVSCQQHPNADKLRVTQVDVGQDELLQIVCGAPNCREGLMVACALVGANLPGDFKIKPAKLRGESSAGMLCSFSELGIAIDQDGIIELPADAPLGQDLRQYLQLDDRMIDVSVTPNRADCFSVIGLARELATINQLPLQAPQWSIAPITHSDEIKVTVTAPEAAPRYLARVIKQINNHVSSPWWLQEKLRRSGIRSIDPVVDVTNYVLLELGHPMHAFDRAKVDGNITVRYSRPNETLVLLDGNEVTLKENTLVISDDQKAIAMAGIFGGESTGVTADTQDIILEAAYFAPIAIAGKARLYGLHTESSHRYERGVDPQLQHQAMERATQLILSICGGEAGPIVEAVSSDDLPSSAELTLRRAKLNQVLGCEIPNELVTDILNRLGGNAEAIDIGWRVTAPSWRFDWNIEADLIEEIARIYGYNQIPNETLTAGLTMLPRSEKEIALEQFKTVLVHQGYQEAITYSFVDPKIQAQLHPKAEVIELPNPISSEMSVMRLSLWSGLLGAVIYNQNRQQQRIKLFETGLRFIPDDHALLGIRQETVLSGVITGMSDEEQWTKQKRLMDFFDLKGDIELLFAPFQRSHDVRFRAANHPALHPGQSAEVLIDGVAVGLLGMVHPYLEKQLGLNGKTFIFECVMDALPMCDILQAQLPSRYPTNRRDIAILVNKEIPVSEMIDAMKAAEPRVSQITLFDLYQGETVAEHQKSLAFALMMQNHERTLEESEINEIVKNCVDVLEHRFQAQLR